VEVQIAEPGSTLAKVCAHQYWQLLSAAHCFRQSSAEVAVALPVPTSVVDTRYVPLDEVKSVGAVVVVVVCRQRKGNLSLPGNT
jgi:hypothetical protein